MTDQVIIGDLTFEGDGSNGFIYTKLDGWVSGAPMRAVVQNRPNADGAFDVDVDYRGPRIITFTGGVYGSSSQDAEQNFFDAVAGLQGDGTPILFQVVKDWGTRSSYVSIQDVAQVTPVGIGDLTAAVMIQMVARDPVKYGEDVIYATGLPTSGGGLEYNLGTPSGTLYYGANGNLGRVSLTNAGTAAIWPTVVITGTLTTGFYIQCLETGDIVRYDRVVPAGTTVSLDFRTGEVLVDGISDASTYLTSDSFFSVPAGSTRTVQFNAISSSSGSPTMTMTLPAGGWW